MTTEGLAALLGLMAAVAWGSGDFSGGLATKRNHVLGVIVVAQITSVALLASPAILFSEKLPGWQTLSLGGLAGLAGGIGLAALYTGLAGGRMGLVAPLAALVTALFPLSVSLMTVGPPTSLQGGGFVVALAAVWLLTKSRLDAGISKHDLGLALLAGIGSGFFLVFISRAAAGTSLLWPLVSARVASLSLLLPLAWVKARHKRPPERQQLTYMALAGVLDAGGSGFFALASRLGRLDIAAILSSLFPAVTVLLAWLTLGERMGNDQRVGVALVLAALVMISA